VSAEITETRARSSELRSLKASVATSQLLLFCRDLRGTVTDAVVVATGRALVAHPEVGRALRPAGTGVGVAVDADGGVLVPVVRNATDGRLPQVRAEVKRLVDAARAGRLSPADVGGAAVTVYDSVPVAGTVAVEARTGCILAVDRREYDSPDLTLAFTVDGSEVDGEEAGRFFATLVRLLQHPYRLLV
jgi:pyruvate/2-oxoglutarate dehydrogenase complex dihydrolipoamide acyltransferase (E2) component